MDIGDLHYPQSFQVLGQIGDGDRHFGKPESIAPHDSNGRGRQWRDAKSRARCLQHFSPRGTKLRRSAPDREGQGKADQPHGLNKRGAFQPGPPLDGKVSQNTLEFQYVAGQE